MEDLLNKTLENSKLSKDSLLKLDNEKRNILLKRIAKAIDDSKDFILMENEKDIIKARQDGLKESMIERLTLNEKRVKDLIDGVLNVSALPDYVGEVIETYNRDNGLRIDKVRVPFGVIAVIFESRPNVCVDIAALCLKTANCCVLKGGKEAINTNKALVSVMRGAIEDITDPNCITLIESTDRSVTDLLITKKEYIDLLIPRGSKGLIQYVVTNAKVPYIETGAGNCHLYVHEKANLDMAIKVAINAKYQRPSVCNAIENIIVDNKIKDLFLPMLEKEFKKLNIEIRGDEKTKSVIDCKLAKEEDFYTEYNDYIVAVKVVDNLDMAIKHINLHSTKHSEAIITDDIVSAVRFLNEIDSACVYHNASTRFTDGGCFGFGAEIGISTAKLHARGPMGLKEITTYKYQIHGNGEVRE
ncbi:MAG: glutamate-5-semialdehyde dehydrogenase [Acholeplasmatales bacterium]|nr:glutamate-5-semialdehyde dehydrogenase [Acholeplasmatales bacterium]